MKSVPVDGWDAFDYYERNVEWLKSHRKQVSVINRSEGNYQWNVTRSLATLTVTVMPS